MTDAILKKLFTKPSGVAVDCQVTGKKSTDLWLVTDRVGRSSTAISTDTWRPGIDWVTVQDGRIVGRAKRRGEIQVYAV